MERNAASLRDNKLADRRPDFRACQRVYLQSTGRSSPAPVPQLVGRETYRERTVKEQLLPEFKDPAPQYAPVPRPTSAGIVAAMIFRSSQRERSAIYRISNRTRSS